MSVIIKGMETPKSCYKCPLKQRNKMYIVCPVTNERFSVADVNILKYRLSNCPIFPFSPHGRLIDADAIRANIDEKRPGRSYEDAWALTVIDAAPTIIPAEEEDNEYFR